MMAVIAHVDGVAAVSWTVVRLSVEKWLRLNEVAGWPRRERCLIQTNID